MNRPLNERLAKRDALQDRIWLASIWSCLAAFVFFGVFFGLLAGFLPPPGESWSSQEVVAFYAENLTGIRLGLIGALFATALLTPFFTIISLEMRKIEGDRPVLAVMQFGWAVIIVAFFQLICMFWLLASFREGVDADIVRAFNDYGWLVWTTLIPTTAGQFILMGVCGFLDVRSEPLWPRWACYANLWLGFTQSGGIVAVFFKTGPFSWNGILGWWIPTISFAIIMIVNLVLLHRHLLRERRQGAQLPTPGPAQIHGQAAL